MNGRRISLAVMAVAAIMATPVQAEDLWSSFRKGIDEAKEDFKGFTGAIKDGIEGIREGKEEVEGIVEETEQLKEEFTGVPENEPRYDPAWVAELQQRLSAQGFDPGPIDGAFGNRTSQAISAFQRQAGISPDGLPRPTVMRALRARTQGIQTAQSWSGTTAPLGGGATPAAGIGQGAPSQVAPLARATYPDFVRLALQADPAAFGAEREVAGVAYRLAVMDAAACRQLVQRLATITGDVFLARDFALESAVLLDEALASLGTAPAALEVRLSDQVHLQPYDFAAGGYPLPASPLIRGGRRDLTDRTSAPPCDAGLSLRHALPKSASTISQIGLGRLSVELEGTPGASILPMAESDARAFEARNGGRRVDLVGQVRLEPPQAAFGPLRGRIMALEARDPATGQTLYPFPAAPQVATGPASPFPAGGQEATYERLLEAHLVLHPEVAGDDDFVLRYLSYLPEDRDCPVEFELLAGSEFDRQRFFTQVWPEWKVGFAEIVSRARAPDEALRIEIEQTAEAYDFATGAFAVAFAKPGAEFTVGQQYSGGERRFCVSPSGASRFPTAFHIDLTNAEAIDRLPLSAGEAEAFDARNPERTLRFVVEFVLEETAQVGDVHGAGQGSGRIVGAAVVDPVSQEVLHRYDPAIFAPPSADPWDAFPAPDYRELLLSTVARSPELARSDAYVERFIASKDCEALRASRDNEIERRRLIDEWRPRLEQEAAGAQDPGVVKVTLEQRLGEYDTDRQAFAFPDSGGLDRHNPARIRVAGSWCPTGLSEAPESFWIQLEPPKALFQAGLPMAPDAAKQLLEGDSRGRKRTVHLDLLVKLGTPGEIDGNPSRVPATLVDARARELDGRTVLHHYGTELLAAGAAPNDPYADIDEIAHEPLMLAYVGSQPELADDPAFAQRYAAATDCEAWAASRGDEFARADLGDQTRQRLRDALAQAAGGPSDARYWVSIEAKLGEYDFENEHFPLEVPVFDQQIYRNLLDRAQPAVLVEDDGKACRRDSVASPTFPDAFLLTLGGAEAIESVGVPVDLASARVLLQRELAQYQDPRAVRIEMIVTVGEIRPPRRTHSQRDEHVSVVAGTVVSARVVEAHSGQPVFDYGAELFGGGPQPVAEPAPGTAPVPAPEGAEFVLVSVAEPAELEAYAVIAGSGLDLPKGGRIKGRFVFPHHETTDLWAQLKGSPMVGVVLSAEQFAQASGGLAGLDLRVEPYRPGGDPSDELRAQSAAVAPPSAPPTAIALPAAPATAARADERGADEFRILDITVGMTEAEAMAMIAGEFSPDQISMDPKSGTLVAEKGPCNEADPTDPAIAAEAGAFCLELQFTESTVSSVALRQVVSGDVSEPALAALRERYGEPALEDQSQPSPSVRRSAVGWGRSLGGSQPALAGIDPDAQRTVLEGHVWWSNGVTVAVLRLDDGRPAETSGSLAVGQEIKF